MEAILQSLLEGLKENDDIARGASISALGAFPKDARVRREIARLVYADTARLVKPDGTVWYPVRERAASWMSTHAKDK
jgi:HEAT repeat protein